MEYKLVKPSYIKRRKRVGCGPSSGHGKTCCRGQKGQKSRSGAKIRPGFEGGQMPLQRRIPKRGFNNKKFREDVQIVNLKDLQKVNVETITPEVMLDNGLIKSITKPIKLLANGELNNKITITVDLFSKAAKEKVEKAGGQIQLRK